MRALCSISRARHLRALSIKFLALFRHVAPFFCKQAQIESGDYLLTAEREYTHIHSIWERREYKKQTPLLCAPLQVWDHVAYQSVPQRSPTRLSFKGCSTNSDDTLEFITLSAAVVIQFSKGPILKLRIWSGGVIFSNRHNSLFFYPNHRNF
jgi:hypothetical protein